MRTAKRLDSLQAGRAIAALSVVLLHVAYYFTMYEKDPFYLRFFHFGHYGVSFFFVLSGIVILLAHWKDIDRPEAWKGYAWKRFRRIYPIYWCVLGPILLTIPFDSNLPRSFWAVTSSILLLHIGSFDSVLVLGWTLFCEITFYGVFSLVILNRRIGITALAAWFAGCVWYAFHIHYHNWLVFYLLPLQVLFVFGMFVTIAYKRNWIRGEPWLLAIGGLILAWTIYRAWARPLFFDDISSGIGCTFIIAALMGWEQKERIHVPATLLFLGDASYSIYLVHLPVLALITRRSLTLHLPFSFLFVLDAVIATAVGIALHLAVERPILAHLGS
jgi:exopolysaccharide production protein ExoZ